MPLTADDIAGDAAACVAAGANLLHLHAYDDDGSESLAEPAVARTIAAVRVLCPGVPISMTTFAQIEPDPAKRLEIISAWEDDPADAREHAMAIEAVLARAEVRLEQVHHGMGRASWPVLRQAITRGHGIRTGLEDVTVLPDGSETSGNAALVRAASTPLTLH